MNNKMLTLLSAARIFFNLDKEIIKMIYPSLSAYTKKYHKGESIFQEGDKIDAIGIILQGELSITKVFIDGKQTFVQKASPSFVIGVDIVSTRSQISPYDITSLKQTEVFFIPYHVIRNSGIINEEARLVIMDNILTLISHENMRKFYMLEILARKSLRERIMAYLTRQIGKFNSQDFTIPLNREQLAEYLCVNRSALSYELGRMKKEGYIDFDKNHFVILKNLKK